MFTQKPLSTKCNFIKLWKITADPSRIRGAQGIGHTHIQGCQKTGHKPQYCYELESDLKERIETYTTIRIEELQEKYRISKEKRIELFGERYLAMIKELKKSDLSEIPTQKLFEMTIRTAKLLESEIG